VAIRAPALANPYFPLKNITQNFDIVVCGGGLAGFCAAVAAARQGAKTCLVQDRPVLGGNSSSEVRVTPHGAAAFHAYARETGIISEVLIEERARNHETIFENGWTNSVWDLTLYDVARTTPNLTLHVNTTIVAVIDGNGDRITETPPAGAGFGYLHRPACARSRTLTAVVGRVANAEVELVLVGKYFIDCTGDGLVADLAGCEWRMGSEGSEEFGEPHAPAHPFPCARHGPTDTVFAPELGGAARGRGLFLRAGAKAKGPPRWLLVARNRRAMGHDSRGRGHPT